MPTPADNKYYLKIIFHENNPSQYRSGNRFFRSLSSNYGLFLLAKFLPNHDLALQQHHHRHNRLT